MPKLFSWRVIDAVKSSSGRYIALFIEHGGQPLAKVLANFRCLSPEKLLQQYAEFAVDILVNMRALNDLGVFHFDIHDKNFLFVY